MSSIEQPRGISAQEWHNTPPSVQQLVARFSNRIQKLQTDAVQPAQPADLFAANASPENLGGHLLVVDDNEMNRDMLSRRLRRQGYDVDVAIDGRQALAMIRSDNFDLILLDIMMPGMNGYEVLEQLRADTSLPYIPVIMITAVDELSSLVRCIELGAEDYLPKPFNPVLLKARIGASLEKKRLRDRQEAYTRRLNQENQRKSDELEQARRIQQAMLPAAPPQLPFLDIAAHQETASEVGGDYYDFFPQPDGTLHVAIGDATGHGVGSGLMVSMTKASLLSSTTETATAALLNQVNSVLTKIDLGLQLNMALLLLKITPENGGVAVEATGGGMPPLYILGKDGAVKEVLVSGLPLGILSEAGYQPIRFTLQSGDVLLLMSDGLLEIFNKAREFLGFDRLQAALAKVDTTTPVQQILESVAHIGKRWSDGYPLYDDMTVMVLRAK